MTEHEDLADVAHLPGRQAAVGIAAGLGFDPTGEVDDGEVVGRLELAT